MKREAVLDFALNDAPGLAASAAGLICAATYGLYSYVSLFGVHFHAVSLFTLGLVYIFATGMLRGVAAWWRPAVASLVVALGIHVYDVLWGLVSMGFRASPLPLGGVLGVGLALLVIWRLDRGLHFVSVRYFQLSAYTIFCVSALVLLGLGGYFDAMTLYDAGLGVDPNVNGLWLASKVCGLFIPLGLLGGRRV